MEDSKPKTREVYNQQEIFQEIFEKARRWIKVYCDLDLTLIELVRLKQYIPSTLEELAKDDPKEIFPLFNSSIEVAYRFMKDYYGLSNSSLDHIFILGIYPNKNVIEDLKILQENAHIL